MCSAACRWTRSTTPAPRSTRAARVSCDRLDDAGPEVNKRSKGVMIGLGDPVRKLPSEFAGELPPPFQTVRVFCPGCLVVQGPKFQADRNAASALAKLPATKDWPLV